MRKLSILTALLIIPCIVLGWGKTGHRVIAQMGQDLLSTEIRKKITSLLGGADMAMVSNWADQARSDVNYKYISSWHYSDFDKDLSREEFEKIAFEQKNGQALLRVYSIAQTLRNRQLSQAQQGKHQARQEQQQDFLKNFPKSTGSKELDVCEDSDTILLKFLIHFTGDMHQPLHLGRPEDAGANRVKIKWFNEETNLHSLWDNKIISVETLSYTEFVQYLSSINKLNPVKISSEEDLRRAIVDWAWEVYQLSDIIYKSVDEINNTFVYTYNYKWIYEQCFCRAAERLAGIMNYIYGNL